LIDRRISQMQAEGVTFRHNTQVGVDMPASRLLEQFDAVALTGGSEHPRDLQVPGRELDGVYFAMHFLPQQNRRVGGEAVAPLPEVSAKGKHVIVIGGGDTGSDCIGTSLRQGAKSVTQLEIMPKPPEKEDKAQTWPEWPTKMRTSSSQAEGCTRDWSVATKRVVGANGKVTKIECIRLDDKLKEIPGTEFELQADLVLLAMGFVHPVHEGMLNELGIELDARGNVQANVIDYRTSLDKVFAAGDMRRGQSLVVWAIREGRQCARAIDEYLMGTSHLPR
ncbi:MAG TPA: glutamate synthase, partial [Alphaproteobacteria bacterium]|nr:glutamate synthase [Alphaproteobacteria bacterium]